MPTDKQSDGGSLRNGLDRARGRRRAARDLIPELERRCGELLRELIPSPTNMCQFSSVYSVSRGRNSPDHNHFVHAVLVLLDGVCEADRPMEQLETARAELDSMFELIAERVVGEHSDLDLIEAIRRESEAGAADDVATVEALADSKIEPPEVPDLRRKARRAEVTARMKRRSLDRVDSEVEV